mmetsp:Transcript_20089/g.29869  ORF Transcript_20089/g.29869 Transcript_20089/m.29869 type:complete len:241 (+) Transcript_20089:65-787(+)
MSISQLISAILNETGALQQLHEQLKENEQPHFSTSPSAINCVPDQSSHASSLTPPSAIDRVPDQLSKRFCLLLERYGQLLEALEKLPSIEAVRSLLPVIECDIHTLLRKLDLDRFLPNEVKSHWDELYRQYQKLVFQHFKLSLQVTMFQRYDNSDDKDFHLELLDSGELYLYTGERDSKSHFQKTTFKAEAVVFHESERPHCFFRFNSSRIYRFYDEYSIRNWNVRANGSVHGVDAGVAN